MNPSIRLAQALIILREAADLLTRSSNYDDDKSDLSENIYDWLLQVEEEIETL